MIFVNLPRQTSGSKGLYFLCTKSNFCLHTLCHSAKLVKMGSPQPGSHGGSMQKVNDIACILCLCTFPYGRPIENEFVRARRRFPCPPGSVLQATMLYNKVPLCIVSWHFVLHRTTLYHKLRFYTTKYHSVLQAMTSYYKVPLCITSHNSVLHGTTLYYKLWFRTYKVPLCTTSYDFVLQRTTLYYKLRLCTTRYHSVLHYKARFSTTVLQATMLYHNGPLCTTSYDLVLQCTTLYYKARLCTTMHHCVLQAMTLYCKVPLCATSFDFVLQDTTVY